MTPHPIVTLLTDFGGDGWYVAAVKGVILTLAPEARLVDVSHDVAPGDVAQASFLLSAACRWFPPGTIHLAVVDPGVGSSRRLLAAETSEAVFLAPDNGLLTPILAGASVRAIDRQDLHLRNPGATFDGRDRFAPVAAFLARGGRFADLGPEIADPVRLETPPPRRESGRLAGRIAHVDRFGNLITDLPAEWLPPGQGFRARAGNGSTTRFATHYAELGADEAAVLPGSLGTLEISLDRASLAERWSALRGGEVVVELSGPAGPAGPEPAG